MIHLPESRLLGQKFAKYIGLSPRVLEQYKKNNDIIYDVIFIAPKVNLRDHKRPKSKNTWYKGFNLKRGFFSAVLIKIAYTRSKQPTSISKQKSIIVLELDNDTGKSLSVAPIFAWTNPQYDDRLFIELQVQ